MIIDRMKNLPARLLGLPLTAEWLVRTALLVVFFVLLTLVASLGFLGWQSFQELGDQIEVIRQTEVNHQKVLRRVSETSGKIQSQAVTALANADSTLVSFAARQELKQLKSEMDERIREGRLTTLSDTPEWERFETSFARYWERINEKTPLDWFAERGGMNEALDGLEKYVNDEREKNDREVQAITD